MRTLLFVLLSLFVLPSSWHLSAQNLEHPQLADMYLGEHTAVDLKKPVITLASGDDLTSDIILNTTIQVSGTEQPLEHNSPGPFHASAAEIISSAGTYGDFSRYLQLFPGVVFNTDQSDDILVRGGNPIENLYLVDGIEVPNINHIATEASTGGFVSMIDTAALKDIDLRTGGYDASYEERLSSVVEIRTRETDGGQRHSELDSGFVGAGGVTESPLANGGSMLISAHRSLLNLFTNDIGLNGVPIYTNALTNVHLKLSPNDDLTFLGLGGVDSIDIKPENLDRWETNTIQTQYSGWRETMGLRWQHMFSTRNLGTITFSDSEQHEEIDQQDQFFNHNVPGEHSPLSNVRTPVYTELTHDGTTNLRYDGFLAPASKLNVIAGAALHLYRIDYDVSQPLGQQSALSSDPEHTDATSFAPKFSTAEESGYAEATWHIIDRWSISGGVREETFQFGQNSSFTPRLSSAFRVSSRIGLHASFGEYAQMPPFIYLTSWPENYKLLPIRARHIVAGADFNIGNGDKISVEVYQKKYQDYPVSTEYPTLSLANMIDTLGQQIFWIPLTSRGTGVTHGIEVHGQAHLGSHFFGQANVAYARAKYAGLDGILRSGNFDYPVVVNVAGSYRPGPRYEATWRYEYSTGRPYTPYLLDASAVQDRPIYDLDQINGLRGPAYSRLDAQVNRTFFFGERQLIVYGGLENVFNRDNLLGYFWMPRVGAKGACVKNPDSCVSPQYQMPRFPNFGIRYVF